MEKYVSGILPQTKIGVVYCDVTGLKRVNDEEMICRISDAKSIYFAGGLSTP